MDNTIIKKKLIKLFAAKSTEEIEAGKGKDLKEALGIEKYRQFLDAADTNLKKYYLLLKSLRGQLDFAAAEAENIDQVKGCLYLLSGIKKNNPTKEDFEILSELIKLGMYKKWNQDEKTYYDTGYTMLAEWKDYFLSYTNRNLIETNNDFKEALIDVLGDEYFADNRLRANCVARLIVHYLRQNNLTAFFDKDNMKCGDMIEEEISRHCKSVYAFVQLVEPVIFQVQDENKKNWCFHEYKTFAEWSSQDQNPLKPYKCCYFILTEKEAEVFPANFPGYYTDWKGKIQQHLNIPDFRSFNKNQVRDKIREIANEIVKTKSQVLENYIGY